jgi:hypothetical protein
MKERTTKDKIIDIIAVFTSIVGFFGVILLLVMNIQQTFVSWKHIVLTVFSLLSIIVMMFALGLLLKISTKKRIINRFYNKHYFWFVEVGRPVLIIVLTVLLVYSAVVFRLH